MGLEYDLSREKDQFKDKAAIKEQWYSSLLNTSNEGILILDEEGYNFHHRRRPPVEEREEYLSKPFESATLIAAVKRLTTRAN